jgi:hypothetical protein
MFSSLMPTIKHKHRRLNSCTPSVQHYIYMSTRSKQSATDGQSVAAKDKVAKAFWTADDEWALVEFLKKHKAKAGDGANFKQSTWVAAAAEMEKHTTKGTWKEQMGSAYLITKDYIKLMPPCFS